MSLGNQSLDLRRTDQFTKNGCLFATVEPGPAFNLTAFLSGLGQVVHMHSRIAGNYHQGPEGKQRLNKNKGLQHRFLH